MLRILAIVASLGALTGCYVEPVATAPAGVAYVGPAYPAPAVGYAWRYHPRYGYGWWHPRRGWYRGWR
jgi:hypothetical protein